MVTEIQFLNLLLVRHVGDTVAKRQIRVKRLAPSLNYLHKHQRLEVHSIQSEKSPNIEQRTRVSIYFLRLDGCRWPSTSLPTFVIPHIAKGPFLVFGDDDSLVLACRTFPLPPFTLSFRREYIPALE